MPAITIINLHQLTFCVARNIPLDGAVEFRGEYFRIARVNGVYRVSEPDEKYGGWLSALMSARGVGNACVGDDIESALDWGEYMRRDNHLPDITPLLLTPLLEQTGDLRGAVFSGCLLAGQNLSGKDLSGATFDKVDLSGAKLRKATFVEATFVDCNLREADARGAVFTRTKFVRVDFAQARLESASFADATFNEAKSLRLQERITDLQPVKIPEDQDSSDVRNAHCGHKGTQWAWVEMTEIRFLGEDQRESSPGTACHQGES